jgi:hypothetical protein
MNNDDEVEEMIASGVAIDAEKWLLERPGCRRIGEAPETKRDFWIDATRRTKAADIVNIWVTDIHIDPDGCEYAATEIYELTKHKGKRKTIFRGLNLRFGLSAMPAISDVGQRYAICPAPSAARVDELHKMLRGV